MTTKRKPLTQEQIEDAQRLKQIFEHKKQEAKKSKEQFSQETVASKCGWTQGGLGHYLNGKIALNLDSAIKLAEALDVNVSDFSPVLASQLANAPVTQEKTTVRKKGFIPVRGSAQMGNDGYWTEYDGLGNSGDGYLEVHNAKQKMYAIRAVGTSMFPAIRSGWFVVFDPDREPMAGEYVHVVLKDGQNMIKEFISNQHGILTLMSVNGMERLSFNISDVEVLNAFTEIQPPSRLLLDIPEVIDIESENF